MTDSREWLWWQQGVVYQVYPRSFKDSNGDGIGDLDGITAKLDYLADLGIDAVWLSPFYPSPMKDFGYDVSDYTDVDPIFGDLAAFDRLIHGIHARGLRLIIDWVPNHSSDQHPWFAESRASRDNAKADWYVWADPKPDGGLPNNWLAYFGGPAWEFEPRRGQYYLHSFLPEQPDLNWRNPAVRAAMLDTLRFWLERGVDGFRVDVAHFIMKDPDMRDNPPNLASEGKPGKKEGELDKWLHLYDRGHADVHGCYRDIRVLLDSYSAERPRYSIGEIHIFDWDEWAGYYGNDDELHMPFNFGLINVAWNVPAVRAVVDGAEAALAKRPTLAWPNYVLGNHDEHRVASKVGPAQARVAMMLLLTLRGTPTVYYGDELGMTDADIPPHLEQDPWGLRVPGLGLGRDPERTPMQWDASASAGFAPMGIQTWLPVAENYREVNVEVQQPDPRSMLAFTKALLALRRATPALAVGDYTPLEIDNPHTYAYLRSAGGARYLILLNFSHEDATIDLSSHGGGVVRLSTHMDRADGEAVSTPGAFTLRADEGVIIALP
jgi:glycosidase